MAKINLADVSKVVELNELARFSTSNFRQIMEAINGNIQFDANISAVIVETAVTSANVEFGLNHNLGRIPIGYILVKSSAVAVLYDGPSANTGTRIFLKANAASNISVMVF